MKLSQWYIVVPVLFLSCSDDGHLNTCGVADPATELQWLKAEIEYNSQTGSLYADYIIYHTIYKGRRVFVSLLCCPVCNTSPPLVRTCSGRLVGAIGDDIPSDILRNAQVIWRTNNGVCP
ncbi:hypothetical protein [Chryseolinea sp. H1M3-3]|uniref:hypothetical protein n=1 Tax=Chryseolinea sp. H1M3-3 TaxID=3034144 RepID=UPI0023EBFB3A|nr:hypothetical protein [Chryseolinea sp. H1M3-3]